MNRCRKKWLFCGIAAFLMVGIVLPGAAGGQKEGAAAPVTIRFAHMWQDGASEDATKSVAILKQVEAANPGMKLVHEVVTGDEMRNKIRVDVAANNTPDMWQFWVGGVLADYVAKGILLDINKFLALSKKVKKEDISKSAWDSCTFDGVIRAFPRNISVGIFAANAEIFKKYSWAYPKNWAEFLALGKKFDAQGVAASNIGSKGGNPSHFWYGDLVCQYEAGVTGTATIGKTLNFRQAPFVKAAEYCDEMRAAGLFPKDVMANGDWAPSIAYYDQGNVAFCYTFAWCFANMSQEIIAKTEIIPIPRVPDGERDTSKFIQGTTNDAYCINAKSFEDPKKQGYLVALMDAVAFDIGLMESQIGSIVSVNNNVMKQVKLEQIADKMMVKTLKYRLANNVSGSPMIWQELPSNKLQFDYQAALDELWAGAIGPQEFIDKCQKSCDEYKASK
jgi:ABC-type glycerol-3-phosphate transport system substrate-binding protein